MLPGHVIFYWRLSQARSLALPVLWLFKEHVIFILSDNCVFQRRECVTRIPHINTSSIVTYDHICFTVRYMLLDSSNTCWTECMQLCALSSCGIGVRHCLISHACVIFVICNFVSEEFLCLFHGSGIINLYSCTSERTYHWQY